MKLLRTLCTLAIIITCFGLIWKGQAALFSYHENRYFSPAVYASTPSSGKSLKPFLFGFDNFVADMYWLKAIQYIGTMARGGDFPILESYANTITDFDPKFSQVYHLGGLLLPNNGNHEAAERILLKGEKNIPEEWQFSYDLGFVYFYYFDDYEKSIAAYERCLQKENCLSGANRLIETLRARTGKVEIAFSNILEQLLEASTEEQTFLVKKAEEIGKLLLLQKTAEINPPKEDISELIGKNVPDDPKLKNAIQVLEELTEKMIVSTEKKIISETLENPFLQNPYIWDLEKQIVRPRTW